jgi:hypothetical protein
MEREILFFAPSQFRAFSMRFLPVKFQYKHIRDKFIDKIICLQEPRIFVESFLTDKCNIKLLKILINDAIKYFDFDQWEKRMYKFLGSKFFIDVFFEFTYDANLRMMKTIYDSISHITKKTPPEMIYKRAIGEYIVSKYENDFDDEKFDWIFSFHDGILRVFLKLDVQMCLSCKYGIKKIIGNSECYIKLLREKNPKLHDLLYS